MEDWRGNGNALLVSWMHYTVDWPPFFISSSVVVVVVVVVLVVIIVIFVSNYRVRKISNNAAKLATANIARILLSTGWDIHIVGRRHWSNMSLWLDKPHAFFTNIYTATHTVKKIKSHFRLLNSYIRRHHLMPIHSCECDRAKKKKQKSVWNGWWR